MFKLEIETHNAAFHDNPHEVANLIDAIAADIRQGRTSGPIIDHNGNIVGNWGYQEEN